MRTTFFVLTFLFIQNCFCQTLIIPGSKLLKYNKLATRTITQKTQILNPNGNIIYETIETKNMIVSKNTNEIIYVQNKSIQNDNIIDSTFADLKTLNPKKMSMSSSSRKNTMYLGFKGDSIYAKVNRSNAKLDTIHIIKEPYFDSNLLEVLLGIIDYEKDSVFRINTYTFEMNGLDSYLVKRISEEKLVLPNQKTKHTWHIIIYQEAALNQGGELGYEFWIDYKSGLVLKQIISFGENRGKCIISTLGQ